MKHTEAIWQQRLAKRLAGMPWKSIIEAEGFKYGGTFTGHLKKARQQGWIPPEETLPPAIRSDGKRQGVIPKQESPMAEEIVEVLPGQIRMNDADTPSEVHYGAISEFDRLPDGYAETIQPMREYTKAEDDALKESVRLFGFIGAIVRDQYGRIIDGNQRARVARWFGQGCPFTITQVKDDQDAMEKAAALNLVRRDYTQEQREKIAAGLRQQGRSYRYIAEALHVSHTQARTDVLAAATKVEPNGSAELQPTSSVESTFQSPAVTDASLAPDREVESTFQSPKPESTVPPQPTERVQRKGGGTYPSQRPTGKQPAKPTSSGIYSPLDIESHLKKVRELVRECLAFIHTGGEIRVISRELVWCARMLEDRAKALKVQPYNSLTKLPTLITDQTAIVEEDTSHTTEM